MEPLVAVAGSRREDRVSAKQLDLLVNFMCRHEALAQNNIDLKGPGGHEEARNLWAQLSRQLNAVGVGSTKSSNRWRKYWTDLKCKVKMKAREDRRERLWGGGALSRRPRLRELELRILRVLAKQQSDIDEDLQSALNPSSIPTNLEEDESNHADPAFGGAERHDDRLADVHWRTEEHCIVTGRRSTPEADDPNTSDACQPSTSEKRTPEVQEDHIDYFFKSIAPRVRTMTERQQLMFQMDVLNVIDKIKYSNCQNTEDFAMKSESKRSFGIID